jgi:undecaprenyl-diphosphatase
MNYLHAGILGIVEGLTEFLPISSTAHLILAAKLLHLPQNTFQTFFEVFIQTGAILAVVFLFWKDLWDIKHMKNLLLSFIPTAVVGLLLYKVIKTVFFESPFLIAGSLIVIGVVFLVVEQRNGKLTKAIESLTWKEAILIGLAQSLAVVPGVSRSGIVMIAMMLMGFKRKESAQYSFMLALPTLASASLYDLFKMRHVLSFNTTTISLTSIGFGVAFVVAYFSMRWFVGFLQKYSLRVFGWYRIALGIITVAVLSMFP